MRTCPDNLPATAAASSDAANAWIMAGNDETRTGTDPLHWRVTHHAARRGWDDTLRIAAAAGWDLHAPDDSGGMPIHHAALCRHPACVSACLDAGADPLAKDHDQDITAWGCAVEHAGVDHGDLGVMRAIIGHDRVDHVAIAMAVDLDDREACDLLHGCLVDPVLTPHDGRIAAVVILDLRRGRPPGPLTTGAAAMVAATAARMPREPWAMRALAACTAG